MNQVSLSNKQIEKLAQGIYFLLTESIVSEPLKNTISEVNSSQESEATNIEHN